MLDLWYKKDGMNSYYCTENDLNNLKFVKERMIVVTHTVILIFELNTQVIDVGYLLSWATIQSLGSIKRAMNEPDRLTFEWKKIGDNQPFSQQFKVPQASEMIELISRNIKKIAALSKERENRKVFSEEDVTGKVIKNIKIVEVLSDIKGLENDLEVNLSLNGVNKLMELYQHAIEYFTATDNLEFQVYLKKLHSLLCDEKVAAVLQYGEGERSTNKGESEKSELNAKKSESKVNEAEIPNREVTEAKDLNENKEIIIQEEKKEVIPQEEAELINSTENKEIIIQEEKKEDIPQEEAKLINSTENKEIIIQEEKKEVIPQEETKLNNSTEKDSVKKEQFSIDTSGEPLITESVKSIPNTSHQGEVIETKKITDEILSQSLETTENSLKIHETEETKKEIQEIVEKFEIGEVSSEDEGN